ncbi:protransforming growth factor alpha-like [Acridotheres tristis]
MGTRGHPTQATPRARPCSQPTALALIAPIWGSGAGGGFEAAAIGTPVAAAVRSHFNECPDSHSQFCFHGTCRFLVQEDKPACVCHSGYVGTRCEHADLLAVVAANQKKQTITALLVVAVVASALLVTVCVLLHCCRFPKRCPGWSREHGAGHEKPGGLLKGGSCCHGDTGGLLLPQ